MRRTLLGLAVAALALPAVPALAEDEPEVLGACPAVAGVTPLTLAGSEGAVPAPATPYPTLSALPMQPPRTTPDTVRTVQLDLAGQPVGTTATVAAVLTWGQFVNDYDLRVNGAEQAASSTAVNPQEMSAREEAALAFLPHCTTVTVSVRNYAAGPDSLTLALRPAVDVPEEE